MQELQSVSEGIVGVDPSEAREIRIPLRHLAGVVQTPDYLVEFGHQDPGVALAGGLERFLDPKVQLQTPRTKPGTTAGRENSRFSTSFMPRTPTKKSRAVASWPGGIPSCTHLPMSGQRANLG